MNLINLKMYINGIICALILTSSCISVVKLLDYSDLEIMGITCQDAVSCNAIHSNFTRRNCECDRNCAIYNDCCIDAITRPTSSRRRKTPFCMPYGDVSNIGVYAINTCPSRFTGSELIRSKCQNSNNISDPLMAAPVTDTVNKRTYQNIYCAECNNIVLENLQTWLIALSCNVSGIDNNNIWRNIIYRQDLNRWGVNLNQQFHGCNLMFDKPHYLSSSVRLCRANIISSCPSGYVRVTVKRNCESYTAVVYTRGENAYKNPHCAQCHGLSVDDLHCTAGTVFKKKRFTVRNLFDYNMSGGTNCRSDQMYDHYTKKCRNKVCAIPGYTKVNDRCVKS